MLLLQLHVTGQSVHEANAPSPAQREAGNYRKDHRRFQGLDISIENPRGTVRRGVDRGGTAWASTMLHDYGYIRGTRGVDGDHFDCVLGPDRTADTAFVITTMAPPTFERVDEQKAMLGFSNPHQAREAFDSMYDNPRFFGSMKAVPMEAFREQVLTTADRPRLLKALLFMSQPVPPI